MFGKLSVNIQTGVQLCIFKLRCCYSYDGVEITQSHTFFIRYSVFFPQYVNFIDLFPTGHKVVHNGGSSKFKGLFFNNKTTDMAQILKSFSYEECSILISLKFTTFGSFILILGTSLIMDQTACFYVLTALEIGLYRLSYDYTIRFIG